MHNRISSRWNYCQLDRSSGATGVVKSVTTFRDPEGDNATTNMTNNVYNLLLSNYNGQFTPGETLDYTRTVSPQLQLTLTEIAD